LKILFLDTEPIRRGAQIFISELSSFLRNDGNECRTVYLYKSGNPAEKQIPLADDDRNLGGERQLFLERLPGVNPIILKRLVREISSFSPEIIVANGSRTLKYAAAARQLYRKDTLWIARWIDDATFWNPGKISRWIYRKLITSQFDALVAVSHSSLGSVIRHYDFKKPTKVIHRVFDERKFVQAPGRFEARTKLGLDESDEVLLFLGNLTTQKRPERFIQIIQELAGSRPNIRGLLVGDGELRGELEQRAWGSKSEKRTAKKPEPGNKSQGKSIRTQDEDQSIVSCLATYVSFKGYQSDVSPFLAAADLLILTSDTEGLPGVVLEAAYFSVPTVASDVGGIRECLIDGETGILVPEKEVSEFCSAIISLLEDTDRRRKLGEAAKTLVDGNFRMEVAGQQYLDFFKSLSHRP
jgi:glycosyltransferase involved in cell wall biosynthesis